MRLITRLWKNFKVQPEIWFFYGFLLTFTLTIRKVLFFFPLRGGFNEYSGVYLYLSDIFLVLALLAGVFIILYNKIDVLSILKNVPRGTLLLPLFLVIWSFVSLIWAENKIVAIFRSVKMLEFYLLYIFILVRLFHPHTHDNQYICDKKNKPVGVGVNWNVPRGTILKKVFGLVMFIGLFQALIGIAQYILQHSIGLFWLKESLISPDIAGVAKVIFNGEAFIRACGLFPHPNILGGFLMFSIFIAGFYYRMFHPSRNVPRGTFHRTNAEQLIKISLVIQLLALILTFSKSAIIGLFLGLIYFAYVSSCNKCSTWNIPRDKCGTIVDFFRKKKKILVVAGLIIIFSVFILKPNWNSLLVKSLDERSVYVNVSPVRIATQSIAGGRGTIEDIKTLIFGIGNSQFVISMENMSIIKENWMLQPVHNVFLLVWSELGIVGLFLLVLFMGYVLKNVLRGTSSDTAKTFGAILIGLLFIMFFDHYLWDIQQGGFLLWITLGFLVGAGECKDTI